MTELGARLWQTELPDSELAMTVAARIIAAEITEPVRAPRRRQRGWAIALAAGLLVALAFTPPGRAVTGEVAELIGIGGPSTVDHDDDETFTPTTNEIVIAAGTTADGAEYELVAFEATLSEQEIQQQAEMRRQTIDDVREAREVTGQAIPMPPLPVPNEHRFAGSCIALDWIGEPDPVGGTACIDGPQNNPLTVTVSSDTQGRYGPAAELMIGGLTGPEVARVEVSYERPDGERVVADGALGRLTGELAERAGTSEQFGSFVAFMPASDVGPGRRSGDVLATVETVAYGDDGQAIKRVEGAPGDGNRAGVQPDRHKLLRFGDATVFPLLNEAGEPVPGSQGVPFLRPSRVCPRQTAALERAGYKFDAFAGTECPQLEAVRAFVASGTPIDPVADTSCFEKMRKAVKEGRISEGQDPTTYPDDLLPCVG